MFAAIVPICRGFVGAWIPMETTRAQLLRLAENMAHSLDTEKTKDKAEKTEIVCDSYSERRRALKKCEKCQFGSSMV